MAVHTLLSQDEIAGLCSFFELGAPERHRGLAAGSINSNYELTTAKGRYFLTLREGKSRAEVETEVRLLGHLSGARFPCPGPIAGVLGAIGLAQGRPVLCFPWLPGEELGPAELDAGRTAELGAHLGRMHVLLEGLALDRKNPYGPATVRRWLTGLRAPGRPDIEALVPALLAELDWCERHRNPALPGGAIHADLFVDNVKWIGGRISAIFDFEMACHDALALDLAITLNAWCFGEDGAYAPALVRALVSEYQAARPLVAAERAGLYAEARFGALRYTVSRIRDFELSELPPERLARKRFGRYLARLHELQRLGPAGFAELSGLAG